ncbi:MAG: 2'-deoxycytidine 5'-triphosphate deaminase domain-containing protein, partial [Rubricella sp.]
MTGVIASQGIARMLDAGEIVTALPVTEGLIQPASLDLRLGETAWRVRASFLPGEGRTVSDRIADFAMHEIDLSAGAVLE